MSNGTPSVSVVIPAYNEEENIFDVVQSVAEAHPDFEILVVDDHSTDGTVEAARKAGARVLEHTYNLGNGAAVKTGIREASGEVILLMDGDGQHPAGEIRKLIDSIGKYDMVVGARSKGSAQSLHRRFANFCFNMLASYVAHFPVKDLTSGFRAIKAPLARRHLYLLPNTFSYPSTLTLSVLRSGRTIKYVPIVTEHRKGSSKIRIFSDGTRFFLIIIRIALLFAPFRIFLPVSLGLFLTGIGWYLFRFLTQGRFPNMSLLLLLSSITIFMLGLVSEQIALLRMDRTEDLGAEEPRGGARP